MKHWPCLGWANILTFFVAIVFVPADIFWCLMAFRIHVMSFLHWNAVQRLLINGWLHEIWPNFDLLDSIYEYIGGFLGGIFFWLGGNAILYWQKFKHGGAWFMYCGDMLNS